MSGYVTFEATIVPMEWGDRTYTVLILPEDVAETLRSAKRVEGEFNDHPVNLAPSTSPVVDGVFLWTGKTLMDRIGLAPHVPFEARLRPADPDKVDVPGDVTRALRSAGCTDAWDNWTAGKQRGELYKIESAKRAETRAKRIGALIRLLESP